MIDNASAITPDVGDALTLSIRDIAPDDLRYIADSWKESHKDSPETERMPWPLYKQTVCKQIDQLLAQSGVRVIAAYEHGGKIVSWLCYSPGKKISAVHWTYTRHALGDAKMRRRGAMSLLLDAADLGPRFVYTFRGPRRNNGSKRKGVGDPLDVAIVAALRGRGITAVYVPLTEWLA